MAASASNDDEMITGINVTPLVDITLVLLVILMVTASYVASKAIPMELPHGATGEATPTTLSVSIDREGKTYLDATAIDEPALRQRIKAAHTADPEVRAVIAADGRTSHASVVHVIDLLRREDVTKFAINIDPEISRSNVEHALGDVMDARHALTATQTPTVGRKQSELPWLTGLVLISLAVHAGAVVSIGRAHADPRAKLELRPW